MRRSIFMACLAAAALAMPAVASAVPQVIAKGKAIPIPGYPGTGNFYGKGAAVQAEYLITGTEYFGSPPPVIGVNVFLPTGTELHQGAFPTCSEAKLQQAGPSGCPAGSKAGPIGTVLGFVTFGGERVEEQAELFSFYKPGGGFIFFTFGHTPTVLEVYSSGSFVNLRGAGGYGPELKTKVPLVPSVPGAPFASVKSIQAKVGSAIRVHGKPVYYGTVPKEGLCPKGGFRVKTEVIFAENGEEAKPVTVTNTFTTPCPPSRHHAHH
ncbi:MAG TPA: hypothetical protein VMD79_03810 [Solirubrobacteraceae bacterium]|nr:hypothetical protein [Solirubrobacteraceae bacterium]